MGIDDALNFVCDVIDGEGQLNEAKKKSDNQMKKNLTGIAALGAIAALGIHVLTNKNEHKKGS